MKAIICAAGDSKRMSAITQSLPKPLLPLVDKSIIENLLDAIAIKPVDGIIILVGYLGDKIKGRISDAFNGIPVSYIMNKSYSKTNNMYSIYLAKENVKDDIVFVAGDVYINPKTAHDFILNGSKNAILVDNDPKHFNSGDPVKVNINKNLIKAIDKNLPENQINGIAIGAYKLSYSLIQEYFKIAEDLIGKKHLEYGYIEPIKILIKNHKIVPFYIGKKMWFDIDTIEEYKKAKEILKKL